MRQFQLINWQTLPRRTMRMPPPLGHHDESCPHRAKREMDGRGTPESKDQTIPKVPEPLVLNIKNQLGKEPLIIAELTGEKPLDHGAIAKKLGLDPLLVEVVGGSLK